MTDEPDQSPPPLGETNGDAASTGSERDTLYVPPSASSSHGAVAIGQGKLSESDDKTFGMLSHLLGAFTSFVGPLVIWMVKREESPFVNDQGREALNFQITVLIGYAACFVVGLIPVIGCMSALLMPAVAVAGLVFSILGCLEANKGTAYRYPFALRLVT